MKKILLFIGLLCIGVGSLLAQTVQVSGTVTGAEDGQPLPGAMVLIKGTTNGGITDANGKYTVSNVSENAILEFSFIGLVTQEITVGEKRIINVVMASEAQQLDEVVVTALGIVREKRAIGYSTSTVSGEELTETRTSDVLSAISGKMAGVQIGSSSSDPGASNSIIVRGISSLSGNNQALFVVDGVPINNSTVRSSADPLNGGYDYGNAANLINPDDIASMTVLKGAAATAIYGNRAANGVVMITTKSGQHRKGLGIEYNGGIQFSSFLRVPEMQNEFGQGWDGLKTTDENGSWGPRFDGAMRVWGTVYDNSQKMKPYVALPNNLPDFFETGFRYNNSLSFSGGNEKTDFFVSFSQLSDDGMIPDPVDTYDKYTFSVRGSHTMGRLKVSTSINYATQENNFAPTGQGLTIINSLMQTPRDISIVGLKDLSDPFNSVDYYYTPYGVGNPYYIINVMENTFGQDKLYGKVQADYKFTDYLSATYRLGLDAAFNENKIGMPRITATPGSPNEGAIDSEGTVVNHKRQSKELNHDILVNFNKQFVDKFDVNILAGMNINERKFSEVLATVTGLDIPTFYHLSNSPSTPTVGERMELRRLYGFLGEAQVGYNNMLYLTLTARNDWSSTLPKGSNSFFYPGTTLSFVFTELLSDEIKEILSFGKLRLAYGKTGNDANPYILNPYYLQNDAYNEFGNIGFPLKGKNAFTLGNMLGNMSLSPEMTTEYEIGANLSFFQGRAGIDVAYYDRKSNRQIFDLDMDPATGFTSQTMNLGEISNKGVEVLLNVTPVKTNDFSWNLSVNYTKNNSKVVSLPEELGGEASIWGFAEGTNLVAAVGKPVGVYKVYSTEKTPDGRIVVNAETGLPVLSGEAEFVDDSNFDYEMGIGNTFKYKDFSLGFDFDIRQGGLIFSRTKDILYFTGNAKQTLYNDRAPFIVPNSVNKTGEGEEIAYVENTTPVASAYMDEYFTNGTTNGGAEFLIPRSYVKLRSATIGYTLPKSLMRQIPFVESIRVSAFGTNLLLWTPKGNTFIDPEVTTFGNDLEGKFGEFSANPSTRKYGFNLAVKF